MKRQVILFRSLLALSALPLLPSIANAGTLYMDVEGTGAIVRHNPEYPGGQSNYSWDKYDGDSWWDNTGCVGAPNKIGWNIDASSSGSFEAVVRWIPAYTGEVPPAKIVLRTLIKAEPRTLQNATSNSSVVLTASVTSPTNTKSWVDNLPASSTDPARTHTWKQEESRKLIQIDPVQQGQWINGALVVRIPMGSVNSKAELTIGTRPGPNGTMLADDLTRTYGVASASINQDTREVKLTRGGRFEYSEISGGEWHTYGDSIYSALSPIGVIGGVNPYINILTNYIGNWKTTAGGSNWDITPTWIYNTPTTVLDPVMTQDNVHLSGSSVNGTPTVDAFGVYHGQPTGESTHNISYTAKDNGDNATAKAHFHLTLHDPAELLNEGESTSTYDVYAPLKNGSQVMAWTGLRDKDTPETTVKVGESTETGYDLTATVNANPIKDLIGFSAEAHLTSTKTLSIDTEAKVPAISAGMLVYIIVKHSFQRTHSRFLKYDTQGRVPRMVTMNSTGATYNPPIEMYHEAFRDTALEPSYEWSSELVDTTPVNSLPTTPMPPLEYDFSGDVS